MLFDIIESIKDGIETVGGAAMVRRSAIYHNLWHIFDFNYDQESDRVEAKGEVDGKYYKFICKYENMETMFSYLEEHIDDTCNLKEGRRYFFENGKFKEIGSTLNIFQGEPFTKKGLI